MVAKSKGWANVAEDYQRGTPPAATITPPASGASAQQQQDDGEAESQPITGSLLRHVFNKLAPYYGVPSSAPQHQQQQQQDSSWQEVWEGELGCALHLSRLGKVAPLLHDCKTTQHMHPGSATLPDGAVLSHLAAVTQRATKQGIPTSCCRTLQCYRHGR